MSAIACLLMFSSLIVPSTSTGQVYYVKPESMSNCSYHPCLTLDHYVAGETHYFTAGSVFIFLAGHHSFQTTINLNNISNIILRGEDSDVIISNGITPISFQSSRKLTIEGLVFRDWHVSVLSFDNCSDVLISNSSFEWIIADAKTINVHSSTITIMDSSFEHNSADDKSYVNITDSVFFNNTGGAIYCANNSLIYLKENNFSLNTVRFGGGAIYCFRCTLTITGCNSFQNNTASDGYSLGGAISILLGSLVITNTTSTSFTGNKADTGGAISLNESTASIKGDVYFKENSASSIGGAILFPSLITDDKVWFINNVADNKGGAIGFDSLFGLISLSGNFLNNRAKNGGAVYMVPRWGQREVTIKNINVTGNSESGLWISGCNIIFSGYVNLINNSGTLGGAIFSENSLLLFTENVVFESNSAESGGAVYMLYGSLSFSNNTLFTHNSASINGGALYVIGTDINVRGTANIVSNLAQNGGAMYLESGAHFTISEIELDISRNSASEYGGAIYHQDTVTSVQ